MSTGLVQKMPFRWVLSAALCLLVVSPSVATAGEDYVLRLEYETDVESRDTPSRSSTAIGSHELGERILGTGSSGTEIEYYKPGRIQNNDEWMFPARILVAPDGSKTILNPARLSTRLENWLAADDWNQERCPHRLFSWATVDVGCDISAIVPTIEAYGMRPGNLSEEREITAIGARGPLALAQTGFRYGRRTLSGIAPIDPVVVREAAIDRLLLPFLLARALSHQPEVAEDSPGETAIPSREVAAEQIEDLQIEGTLTVELEVDDSGIVWKRTDIAEFSMEGATYGQEEWRSVQTVTRIAKQAVTER